MITVPILLSRKTGTFSEISIKNLGHLRGEKRTYFKNQNLQRKVATHTYKNALRPLHKTL
jgi:hypothetical protein